MEYTGLTFRILNLHGLLFALFVGGTGETKRLSSFLVIKLSVWLFILTIENRSPKDTKLEQAEELDLLAGVVQC